MICIQSAGAALHKPAGQRDQQTPERPWRTLSTCLPVWTGAFVCAGSHFNLQSNVYTKPKEMKMKMRRSVKGVVEWSIFWIVWLKSLIFIFKQRQQKIQKDRLMNDFSAALNNFQAVQRRAAEKEKESVARARAGSRLSVRYTYRPFKNNVSTLAPIQNLVKRLHR